MKFVYFLLITFSTATLFAQPENVITPAEPKNQLAFDATSFFKTYLFTSSQNVANNPFNFAYKRFLGHNMAIRSGVSLGFTNLVDPDRFGTGTRYVEHSRNMAFRGGIEKRYMLSNRFMGYVGIDLGYQFVEMNTVTSGGGNENKFSQTQNTATLNPLAGIEFNISGYFSIYTEASMNVFYTKDHVKTSSDGPFGGIPTDEKNETNGMNYRAPVNIYFAFKF